MKKNYIFILFLICSSLFSFEWPMKNKIVTATFGERRWDHYHTGIDIGGGEQEVHPAEDGEIVFYFEESSASKIPSGMGNFVVMEHQRGLRTLYAHLKEDTIDSEKAEKTREDVLGVSGNSGGSLGTHLHFEVIDTELKEIINPLLILPALKDRVRPKILNVMIEDEDSVLSSFKNRINLKSPGTKKLFIETYDTSPWVTYHCPVAPYEISVFFNSEEIFHYKYEKLLLRKNNIVLNNYMECSEYYTDTWVISVGEITFSERRNTAKIIVKDINGNETSRIVYINIEE